MKKILFALALLLAPAAAQAANCSGYSYTLTNGQTADASQVMSNFNTILSCANNNLANAPSGVNSNITSFTQGVSFGSTLGVTGATTLSGNTTVGGTLGVTGAATLTGGITSPNWVLNAGNSLYIYDGGSNTLGFRTGTLGSPRYVNIDATGTLNILNGGLTVGGNSTLSGTLGVTGNATIIGTLGVSGGTSVGAFAASGNANITGTLTVSGGTTLGALQVNNNAAISGTLGVTGAATFSSSVSASSFSGAGTGLTGTAGSLSIGGNAATATTATNLSGGSVNGTTGTFSGAVSGTTGTFSGALSGASVTGSMVANAATTVAGVSSTTLITPAGFAGTSSIGASGYYALPGGLYMQWGSTGAIGINGAATVTLPYASCGTIYSVQATKVIASGNVNDSENIVNLSTTGFQISNGGTAATNAYWFVLCK